MIRNFLAFSLAAALVTLPAVAAPHAQSTHDLLDRIQFDAQLARRDAGRLESYTSDRLDWMAQGLQLTTLRDEINSLGRNVYRLQTEKQLSPAEQKLVDRVGRRVNLMGNDAEDAILWGRNHRDVLWNPQYEKHVRLLSSNAARLTDEVKAVVHFESNVESD